MQAQNRSILLVDDTPDFRSLFSQALKSKNISLQTFSSATDALHYLKEAQTLPALIFVDLRMPDMPGEEFLMRIRSEGSLKEIRVIVTSGWNDIAKIAEKFGANGFLRKPFNLDDLFNLIEREFDSSKPHSRGGNSVGARA